MAASTSPSVALKAAGGVRTLDRLLDLVDIGVTRFGATATATILDDAAARAAATGSIPVPPAPKDEQAAESAGY
jgi:deoxyribose-phosphate aldolase